MDTESLRKQLRTFFHSATFHIILATLIAIDLSIVLFDIIILLIYCEDDIPDTLKQIVDKAPYASIAILGVFLIELTIQIYAFGYKQWTKNCMHVFDFIIVLITFIAEIVLHTVHSSLQSVVGLLIAFRLWRMVRVIHVTTEIMDLKSESKIKFSMSKVANVPIPNLSIGNVPIVMQQEKGVIQH